MPDDERDVYPVTLPSGREVLLAHCSQEILAGLLQTILSEALVRPTLEEFAIFGEAPADDVQFIVKWATDRDFLASGPQAPQFKM